MTTDLNSAQWQQIQTGGSTTCVTGTPYAFFARHGTSNNLLIYFQPGGAMMAGSEFDAEDPAFDPSVYIPGNDETAFTEHWDSDNPANMGGIFNLTDERNPFTDYNMLFVPYCSGDLHWGNKSHGDFHYKGYINATTALNWAYKEFPNQTRVFVAGSSAGASGASFHAGLVGTHYPHAQIAVLCDSLGGPRGPLHHAFQGWGADGVLLNTVGYDHLEGNQLAPTTPYIVTGKQLPNAIIAQFNTTNDFAQTKVLAALGSDLSLIEALAANHADIRAEIDNFRTYIADDKYHVILRKDLFYEEVTNSVPLHEWVMALARGEDVENVSP